MPDDKALKGSTELFGDWVARHNSRWPQRPSTIGKLLPISDLCVKGYQDLKFKKQAFTKAELSSLEYLNSPEGQAGDQFRYSREYRDYMQHANHGLFEWDQREWAEHEKYQVKWPSSLDGLSYVLAMHHNVEIHIDAIQNACAAQDLPLTQARQLVTPDLLEFAGGLCEEILTSERPMELIDKHAKMLANITGMRADNDIHMTMESIL